MTKQYLQDLLKNISGVSQDVPADFLVNGMSLNSRAISKGMLFVALKGTQMHGLNYAKQAEENGAAAVIWEADDSSDLSLLLNELNIPVIEVDSLSSVLGEIAKRYFQSGSGMPSYGLKVIGITGTDGKTTVSHFFAQAMNALGKKAAVIGTLGIGVPGALKQATHTTPDVISCHEILRDEAADNVRFVAMEVSSHALDQGRVDGVDFSVGVLTNLTRDHLDYHGTIEDYAAAKQRLFVRPELDAVVLNEEDVFSKQIQNKMSALSHKANIVRYAVDVKGGESAELLAHNAKFTNKGIKADIFYGEQRGVLEVGVLGWFNLSNLLATMAAMLSLNVSFDDALKGLAHVNTVPGRMERVDGSDALVVVDYAHTPGALESVLKALRGHTEQKIICVFGCGGDRDRGKRPLMAQIAEKGADVVIVTDDNPRTENPKTIMKEIVAGFENTEQVIVEHDRAAAIRLAMQQAKAGDVVLVAGKGHEQVQILAHGTEPFDDRQQAVQAMRELVA